jgi:hypothetical protein
VKLHPNTILAFRKARGLRGLDVGAKEEVYGLIRGFCAGGVGVLPIERPTRRPKLL